MKKSLIVLQRVLGQILFYPPNVAGWPGGKTWIDSSTLMLRMRIPQLINDVDEMNMKAKDDDDQMMGKKNSGRWRVNRWVMEKTRVIRATIDWKEYDEDILKKYRRITDRFNGSKFIANKKQR